MEATLSSKNQIVIPRAAREALGVKAGSKLNIVVHDGKVLVFEKPASHRIALRGLAANLYPKHYLKKERESWR